MRAFALLLSVGGAAFLAALAANRYLATQVYVLKTNSKRLAGLSGKFLICSAQKAYLAKTDEDIARENGILQRIYATPLQNFESGELEVFYQVFYPEERTPAEAPESSAITDILIEDAPLALSVHQQLQHMTIYLLARGIRVHYLPGHGATRPLNPNTPLFNIARHSDALAYQRAFLQKIRHAVVQIGRFSPECGVLADTHVVFSPPTDPLFLVASPASSLASAATRRFVAQNIGYFAVHNVCDRKSAKTITRLYFDESMARALGISFDEYAAPSAPASSVITPTLVVYFASDELFGAHMPGKLKREVSHCLVRRCGYLGGFCHDGNGIAVNILFAWLQELSTLTQ